MTLLRDATEHDATAIAAIYAPYCRETPISFEVEPPSTDEMRKRIETVLPQYPWLICQCDDGIAGYAYAGRHHERAAYRWSVNVAIYLSARHHRRGIGRALYSALFSMLVEQGYFTAFAGITLPNEASEGLHRSMGFENVGIYHAAGYKQGAWHDVIWLEKRLQPLRPDPTEPVPAAQLRGTPQWREALSRGQSLLEI
jgi:phosphinothricin acetyltransferase